LVIPEVYRGLPVQLDRVIREGEAIPIVVVVVALELLD
jgi:hypothetical protein